MADRKKNKTDSMGNQPTNDEQMLTRQSAPRPTMEDYIDSQRQMMARNSNPGNAIDGFRAVNAPIGREAVQKATQILQKYKQGKANLENRIVENEQWYKLRHWDCIENRKEQVEPTSAWLFNCIANKHADAMDSFPTPNVLPREEGDKAEAEMLTSILPVVLEQNDFEATYDAVQDAKLKSGTGIYGIFWNPQKLNGLGDISIEEIDIVNVFWEPGIKDIQQSRHFFHCSLTDNETLESQYPMLKDRLSSATISIAKYIYDDSVDTSDKSVVVDWYYHKANSQGKPVIHYVKYVNDTVLFASENEPEYAERGLYDHGKYPFVFSSLYKVKGTPAGFGYIDIGRSAQEYIDRGNQAIMKNFMSNTKPRYFIRDDGSVREEEYADMTNDFVHVDGNLGQDSIIPIEGKPLSEIYVSVITNKVDELKETTGNRDISTGGTTSGVTAASAIAAMQEAGSKLSRDSNKSSYRDFRELCLLVIELIRQFYDLPRCFRIMGQNGAMRFVQYSNQGIQPQIQGNDFGMDLGMRIPLFDIEVTAQKQSPYSKMSQNELALQFYNAGFFNPQMADQALACLDMMDFDRKEFVMQKISQNGSMYQMILQLQQQMMALGGMVDASRGGNEITVSLAKQFGMQAPAMADNPINVRNTEALGEAPKEESEITKKSRERVAESTAPR